MSNNEDKTPKFKALFHCINHRAGGTVTSCGARGAPELARELQEEWAKRNMALDLKPVHCLGRCHLGPTLRLVPGGQFLVGASKPGDGKRIVDLIDRDDIETLNTEYAEMQDPD